MRDIPPPKPSHDSAGQASVAGKDSTFLALETESTHPEAVGNEVSGLGDRGLDDVCRFMNHLDRHVIDDGKQPDVGERLHCRVQQVEHVDFEEGNGVRTASNERAACDHLLRLRAAIPHRSANSVRGNRRTQYLPGESLAAALLVETFVPDIFVTFYDVHWHRGCVLAPCNGRLVRK